MFRLAEHNPTWPIRDPQAAFRDPRPGNADRADLRDPRDRRPVNAIRVIRVIGVPLMPIRVIRVIRVPLNADPRGSA